MAKRALQDEYDNPLNLVVLGMTADEQKIAADELRYEYPVFVEDPKPWPAGRKYHQVWSNALLFSMPVSDTTAFIS